MQNYSAMDIAAFIVQESIDRGKPVSNLQLQKILFFTQCDYMKKHNGETLFSDSFEAWQYGPVVPSVYNAYAPYGGSAISKPAKYMSVRFFEGGENEVKAIEGDVAKFVKASVEKWGKLPAWRLVERSHSSEGAWYKVYNADGRPGSGYREEIPISLIKSTL